MCPSLVPEEAELLISLHQSNSINSSTTIINTPKSTISSIPSINSTDDKLCIDKSIMPKLEPLSPVSLTTTNNTNTSPVNYNNIHAQQPIYTILQQNSINQLQHNSIPQQYTPLHPHNVIPYPSQHNPTNYTNKQFTVIPPSMIQLATPIQYSTIQQQQQQQSINVPLVHNKSNMYTSHPSTKSTSADSTTIDTESDSSTNSTTRKKKRLARKAELARLSRLRKKCKLNDLECNANDLKIRCQQQQTMIESLQSQIQQLQSNTNNNNNNNNQNQQNNKYTLNDAIECLNQYSQQSVSARLVSFMRLHHLDSNALVILAQSMRDVKITPEQLTKLHVTIKSSAAPTIECNQLLDTINKLSNDIDMNDKYNQHCYEQLQSVMKSDQLDQLLKLVNDTDNTINLDQTI